MQTDHGPLWIREEVLANELARVRVYFLPDIARALAHQSSLSVVGVLCVTVVEEDQVAVWVKESYMYSSMCINMSGQSLIRTKNGSSGLKF